MITDDEAMAHAANVRERLAEVYAQDREDNLSAITETEREKIVRATLRDMRNWLRDLTWHTTGRLPENWKDHRAPDVPAPETAEETAEIEKALDTCIDRVAEALRSEGRKLGLTHDEANSMILRAAKTIRDYANE